MTWLELDSWIKTYVNYECYRALVDLKSGIRTLTIVQHAKLLKVSIHSPYFTVFTYLGWKACLMK